MRLSQLSFSGFTGVANGNAHHAGRRDEGLDCPPRTCDPAGLVRKYRWLPQDQVSVE